MSDAPTKADDKSEWVNYAMNTHDLASYEAWALTLDELYALAPAPPPKTTTKGKANG